MWHSLVTLSGEAGCGVPVPRDSSNLGDSRFPESVAVRGWLVEVGRVMHPALRDLVPRLAGTVARLALSSG